MPKAIVCRELGPPESLRLETFDSRPLQQGQVRVAIRAAGINFPDILMAAGEYQLKPDLPFIPGMEAAGDVAELSDNVTGFKIGDQVIVKLRHGGYADEVVVAPAQLTPLPLTFDYAEGATFLAAYGTAYHALVDRAQLKPGDVLLVHGADHGVLYGREPFRDAVKRITDGRGADVVFDPVGGELFEQSLRCISWGARLLVIGFTGGIGVAKTNLVLIKGASVLGVRAGEAARRDPTLGAARITALLAWAEAGQIRPHVSYRLPLQDVAVAMRLLIDRKAIGRVALMM